MLAPARALAAEIERPLVDGRSLPIDGDQLGHRSRPDRGRLRLRLPEQVVDHGQSQGLAARRHEPHSGDTVDGDPRCLDQPCLAAFLADGVGREVEQGHLGRGSAGLAAGSGQKALPTLAPSSMVGVPVR